MSQKGFAPIILLVVVAVAVVGYLLFFGNKSVIPSNSLIATPTPIPTTIPDLSVLDKQDPTNFVIYKYINRGGIPDAKPVGEIVIKLPPGTKVTNQEPVQLTGWGLRADVAIGDKSYKFTSAANPHGLCGSDAIPNSDCSSTDEGDYRLWKDEKGIFAISLGGLNVSDYSGGVIVIVKNKPDLYFSQVEVDQWKSIIDSAKVYQSDPWEPCLIDNSCK